MIILSLHYVLLLSPAWRIRIRSDPKTLGGSEIQDQHSTVHISVKYSYAMCPLLTNGSDWNACVIVPLQCLQCLTSYIKEIATGRVMCVVFCHGLST